MAKDKYDFIAELLESKKLNQTQKAHFLKLASQEMKREGMQGKIFEERIARLEELIFTSKADLDIMGEVENGLGQEGSKQIGFNGSMKNKSETVTQKKKRPKPKETYEFLSHFSDIDGGLKNLTHAFSSEWNGVEYESFIKKCKDEFNQYENKYPNLPDALKARIKTFAFSETKDWFIRKGNDKKYKSLGWSRPEFVAWYKENKIHPANDAYYNKEMIIPFKESIQIRSDMGNLIRLINDLEKIVFRDVKLRLSQNLNSAQFYTDVDNLGNALYHIFTIIQHISDINFCDEVEIDYQQKDEFKTLYITHFDSKATKSVEDKDFLGGDLNEVERSLWSLCNYDIIAKFPEGCFRKVILTDNIKESNQNFRIKEEEVKGFTHVLKFY